MSYAASQELQAALFTLLSSDAALAGLVGDAIYDAVPGIAPDLFVALGPERVRGRADASGRVATHDLSISVVTRAGGYASAKRAAARISDIVAGAAPPLGHGRVIDIAFLRARARRDEGEGTRRVDLYFRARLDDPAA